MCEGIVRMNTRVLHKSHYSYDCNKKEVDHLVPRVTGSRKLRDQFHWDIVPDEGVS